MAYVIFIDNTEKSVINALMFPDPVLPSYVLSSMESVVPMDSDFITQPNIEHTSYLTYRYYCMGAEVYIASTERPPATFNIVEGDNTMVFSVHKQGSSTAPPMMDEISERIRLSIEREMFSTA